MLISIAQFQIFFLALTRVMAILIHLPVLGGQTIPTQIRVALGLLLTLVVVPWQPVAADAQIIPVVSFIVAIAREMIIGTISGFAVDLSFAAIQMAGELISTTGGFTASKVLNPALGEATSAVDQLFLMISVLIFLTLNGQYMFLFALQKSFTIIPIQGPLPLGTMEGFMRMTGTMIATGVQMALPMMAALFMTDLVLGLLARAEPQIQVFFLGLPLKIGISLLGLSLVFVIILPVMNDIFKQMGTRMLKLLGG